MVSVMTVALGTYGFWTRTSDATPELVSHAEDLGFGAFWVGGSPPGDLRVIEELLDATETIVVVTGIVNMWRDDAGTVGSSYLQLADKHPGRFILGVGVGHPESTAEYAKPIDKVNHYLDVLDRAGVPKDAMLLAALGPVALRIAAERTLGSHPYITTPRHTRMAREVMGSGPILAPEQKIILDLDSDAARRVVRQNARRYLELTNYRRSFLREGWTESDLGDGGSDRLIDLLGLHGTTHSVVVGLKGHLDAGADHVSIQILGEDIPDQLTRLAAVIF